MELIPSKTLAIYNSIPHTRANGPGLRAGIWLQGCEFNCPGCFNPETHSFGAGKQITVDALVRWIRKQADDQACPIEGVTFSGGEPMLQWEVLKLVLMQIRKYTSLSILIFTGFTKHELLASGILAELNGLGLADIVIAGRYNYKQRIANGLIGSANKETIFLSGRYSPADLQTVPPVEIIIREGQIITTGIDPVAVGG